jgi:hypothetical protein
MRWGEDEVLSSDYLRLDVLFCVRGAVQQVVGDCDRLNNGSQR